MIPNIACFLGRFQPFHIGHMSIVEEILQNHERLILVIGSSNKSGTDENPWTVEEREVIIRAMVPLELQERIDIAWLPDTDDDDEWAEKLTSIFQGQKSKNKEHSAEVVLFTGNEWVREICERHGIQTQWILSYDIDISGTRIREMIKRGEDVSKWTVL